MVNVTHAHTDTLAHTISQLYPHMFAQTTYSNIHSHSSSNLRICLSLSSSLLHSLNLASILHLVMEIVYSYNFSCT